MTLTNSTLSGNEAGQYVGGIDAYQDSSARLTNVTFTKNSSGAPGGGFHFDGNNSNYKIKNIVSAGNSTGSFGPDCDGAFVSLGGNVVGDQDSCGNLDHPSDVFKNPKLGAFSMNGGPTRTHSLKSGSPAIGRGRPGCPGSDQRGAPRKDCDSGSYERVKCEGALVAIIGTGGKDKLQGTNGPDGILGLCGKDRLVGKGAGDGLCGGKGNDRLLGGGGDDSLDGEGGNDTCVGGSGNDQAKACETEKSL
ncbi:MAG TPA: choice-of-anchor Q domain-containing protein [Actinomycetota bacterium]|nr:choice-of-anchor Q domain-containing protein [Actinomycetota bacterium]